MKKIGLLTRTLSNGGAERVIANLSFSLSTSHDVKIILFDANRIDYDYMGEVVNLNSRALNNIFSKIITFIKRILMVRKIKARENIETTISFLDSPNIVNIFSRKNDKIIVSVRNFKSLQNKGIYNKLSKLLIKSFYNKADVIVAVSELLKQDLIANYNINKNKVKVIYNPYDIEKINELAKEEIEDHYKFLFDNHTIISVGSLTSQKGHSNLIDVVSKISKVIPNIKLIILGEGTLYSDLKYKVKKLNLESNVYFLGFQKNPFKYIKRAELFVFPSFYEGFPNALVEAMSCGTPVISSDCKSGPREILAPKSNYNKELEKPEYAEFGILMPIIYGQNQIEMWADEIIRIITNKEMKQHYSTQGQIRVNDFRIEKITNQWLEIL